MCFWWLFPARISDCFCFVLWCLTVRPSIFLLSLSCSFDCRRNAAGKVYRPIARLFGTFSKAWSWKRRMMSFSWTFCQASSSFQNIISFQFQRPKSSSQPCFLFDFFFSLLCAFHFRHRRHDNHHRQNRGKLNLAGQWWRGSWLTGWRGLLSSILVRTLIVRRPKRPLSKKFIVHGTKTHRALHCKEPVMPCQILFLKCWLGMQVRLPFPCQSWRSLLQELPSTSRFWITKSRWKNCTHQGLRALRMGGQMRRRLVQVVGQTTQLKGERGHWTSRVWWTCKRSKSPTSRKTGCLSKKRIETWWVMYVWEMLWFLIDCGFRFWILDDLGLQTRESNTTRGFRLWNSDFGLFSWLGIPRGLADLFWKFLRYHQIIVNCRVVYLQLCMFSTCIL